MRLARILEIILYMTLHRAIGLNLSEESTEIPLGIRVKKVELRA